MSTLRHNRRSKNDLGVPERGGRGDGRVADSAPVFRAAPARWAVRPQVLHTRVRALGSHSRSLDSHL